MEILSRYGEADDVVLEVLGAVHVNIESFQIGSFEREGTSQFLNVKNAQESRVSSYTDRLLNAAYSVLVSPASSILRNPSQPRQTPDRVSKAFRSLHEVRLGIAGELFQLHIYDHQNIPTTIIKRSKVHVDLHLLSKSLQARASFPVTRQAHPMTWQAAARNIYRPITSAGEHSQPA